ncbi:hypothetical protein BMW23_0421 [Bodo saltans virus]|uniref:Uncharacterized protein n=1 Tax=Bodo saltans virus TaxID=2024608 RepID=A0A2H4UU62_9VIRU|nr:hypothetical protein QJ851_gp0410 [Bodo saltans virus]ATZ80473.1 hypothetical protein BMW23_0421 [Bodo saltans virus]
MYNHHHFDINNKEYYPYLFDITSPSELIKQYYDDNGVVAITGILSKEENARQYLPEPSPNGKYIFTKNKYDSIYHHPTIFLYKTI